MDEQELIELLRNNLELYMSIDEYGDIQYTLQYRDLVLDEGTCDTYDLRTYESND